MSGKVDERSRALGSRRAGGRNPDQPARQVLQSRVLVIDSATLPPQARLAVAEVSQTANGLRVKMHDKHGLLVSIGKHLGMFVDQVQVRARYAISSTSRKADERCVLGLAKRRALGQVRFGFGNSSAASRPIPQPARAQSSHLDLCPQKNCCSDIDLKSGGLNQGTYVENSPAADRPSTIVNRTVPRRRPNAELRQREYLTEKEVDRLISSKLVGTSPARAYGPRGKPRRRRRSQPMLPTRPRRSKPRGCIDRGAKLSPSPAQLHLRLRHEVRQPLGARVHVLGEFVERLLRGCFCHVSQPCGFFGVNPAATFCECLNSGQAPLRNHLRSVRVLSASGTLQKNVLLQESDGE
jgi:hypothetical protein